MSDDNMNFAGATWQEVEDAVRAVDSRQGHLIERPKVKARLKNLKKLYALWCAHLLYLSGWAMNDEGLPVADTEEEADIHYLEVHKLCAPFREKKPHNLDLLEVVFTRAAARGQYAPGGDDPMTSVEDTSSSGSQIVRDNMVRRLPNVSYEAVQKRRKREAQRDSNAFEEAMLTRQATILADGPTGRATARLFKDIPGIKLAINKEVKGTILEYLEQKPIAQAFLNLPKDELIGYCASRMKCEIFLEEASSPSLPPSPGV